MYINILCIYLCKQLADLDSKTITLLLVSRVQLCWRGSSLKLPFKRIIRAHCRLFYNFCK